MRQPAQTRAAASCLAAALGLLIAAVPATAQEPAPDLSPSDASAALRSAEATLSPGEVSRSPEAAADPTVVLRDLAYAYPQLRGSQRRRARGLLARPTDGSADPERDGYPRAAPIASAESPHFCVFWINAPGYADSPDLTDADLDGTPDFVESVLAIAEYSYGVEVAPGAMGWEPPRPDVGGCGAEPSARSDIYLKQLGDNGLFGYQTVDPGQGRARSEYGYLVLDNDYSNAEYGYSDPTIPASVTLAHEFNHLLQVNYDTLEDVWLFESTATWAEEQVYPEIDDWVNYVPAFARYPGEPITATFPASQRKSLRIYGAAVWNHWLSAGRGGLGSGVIRSTWELSGIARPADLAYSAYDDAIAAAHGRGFSRQFVPFAVATAEWRTGYGGFPDAASYPDVRREGRLAAARDKRFTLDNTAYRLLEVKPRGNGELRLEAEVERGVHSGLALIARDGEPLTGTVTQAVRYFPNGGHGTVALSHPGRYERITAVLVNADGRIRGRALGDRAYSKDGAEFRITLSG